MRQQRQLKLRAGRMRQNRKTRRRLHRPAAFAGIRSGRASRRNRRYIRSGSTASKIKQGKRRMVRKRKTNAARQPLRKIRMSARPELSIIIPAKNERKTIAGVIQQAARVAKETEVIVVCNGSTDGTPRIAERCGAKVLVEKEAYGHDVGRSIGAREAKGDILLFIDADFLIRAEQLRPFITAVRSGMDIALNKYAGPVGKKHVHSVVLAKHVLNSVCFRADLKGASMTTIPHAMSRKALKTIGTGSLSVPPKAMVMAFHYGLRVKAVHFVPVGRLNPVRRRISAGRNLERLILGDHLEALSWWMQQNGERGLRPDITRKRHLVR